MSVNISQSSNKTHMTLTNNLVTLRSFSLNNIVEITLALIERRLS